MPWIKGPEFLLEPEKECLLIPFEKDQIVDVVLLFLSSDKIKSENDNRSCPLERFVSFVDHYSGFQRLIHSLCYIFRAIKACFKKNLKKKEKLS